MRWSQPNEKLNTCADCGHYDWAKNKRCLSHELVEYGYYGA